MIKNTTISENVQVILDRELADIRKHLDKKCRKYHIPASIKNAILLDVGEYTQARFDKQYMTYNTICELTSYTRLEDLEMQQDAVLTYVLRMYNQFVLMVNYTDSTPEWKNNFTSCTIKDESGNDVEIDTNAILQYFLYKGEEDAEQMQTIKDWAVAHRHAWLCDFLNTQIKRGCKEITTDDIEAIYPLGCTDNFANMLQRVASDVIFSLYIHGEVNIPEHRKEEYIKELKITREQIAEFDRKFQPETKSLRESTQVISTFQNTADLFARRINTADTDEYGITSQARPLLLALEEKKKAAEALAKQGEKQGDGNTGMLLTSPTYIMQALRGALVIANTWKPIADGKEKATYSGTLLEITKVVTGQNKPAKTQIEEVWNALRFLSTQQVEFIEYVSVNSMPKRRGRKPKNVAPAEPAPAEQTTNKEQPTAVLYEVEGKKQRFEPVKVLTNPLTATFRQKMKENEPFSGSTEVTLEIHHIITEGRRQERIELPNGTIAFIKQPVAHLHTMQQLYAWNSPQEICFYGVILSRSHMNEIDLLKKVFDYDSRIDLHKSEAEKKEAKKNISKHMHRDRDTLSDMFIKAKETGLIAWYSRSEAKAQKDNKPLYVWKWGRPEGADKQIKQY